MAAAVFTRDVDRARRVSRQINAGTVWTNTWLAINNGFEEGGYKQSGIGRLRGARGLAEFQEIKTLRPRRATGRRLTPHHRPTIVSVLIHRPTQTAQDDGPDANCLVLSQPRYGTCRPRSKAPADLLRADFPGTGAQDMSPNSATPYLFSPRALTNSALLDQGPGSARPAGACPRSAAGRADITLRYGNQEHPSRSQQKTKVTDWMSPHRSVAVA